MRTWISMPGKHSFIYKLSSCSKQDWKQYYHWSDLFVKLVVCFSSLWIKSQDKTSPLGQSLLSSGLNLAQWSNGVRWQHCHFEPHCALFTSRKICQSSFSSQNKCAQYWPSLERETEIFDDLVVKIKGEEKCPNYIIRHLTLMNVSKFQLFIYSSF